MNILKNTSLQGGKYKIVRFIASGGFGCTYEACTSLNERVAIKEFFVADFCSRDEITSYVSVCTQSKKPLVEKLKNKFIDEARVLYKFKHQGIVHVFDVFEENGTAYYVMDYIDGCSLKELVKEHGRLSEQVAIGYVRQVCDALKYVHSHNRLHLDIKPGNIMIDKKGHAVLIDFGVSKQYDEVSGENTSTLIGNTPGYAPIEQLGNNVVTFLPSTDIYSLGATLYKLLTGITPLSANILASGEQMKPLPRTISASTRKAVTSAMCLNKTKRPQSVDEFMQLLKVGNVIEDEKTVIIEEKCSTRYNATVKNETRKHNNKEKSDKKKINEETKVNLLPVSILFFIAFGLMNYFSYTDIDNTSYEYNLFLRISFSLPAGLVECKVLHIFLKYLIRHRRGLDARGAKLKERLLLLCRSLCLLLLWPVGAYAIYCCLIREIDITQRIDTETFLISFFVASLLAIAIDGFIKLFND